MYHVSPQGVDECVINVHYYYYMGEEEKSLPNETIYF